MRKGTIVILALLLVIVCVAWFGIISPRQKATSVNSGGVEVLVAPNETNINNARGAMAWDAVRFGSIYYYYVDGAPERSDDVTRPSDIVEMRDVTRAEAILAVQGSMKKGTYRIIALQTEKGGKLTTCPYVVNGQLRDNGFG